MSEPETITLPRSGVPAKVCPLIRWPFGCFVSLVGSEAGQTREEAIASMDARVLALRDALLPPGAFLVRDDEETRERMGAYLYSQQSGCYPPFVAEWAQRWKRLDEPSREAWYRVFDRILAALRGREA